MKTKLTPAGQLAKLRWGKTTKKERIAHSKKMIEAKKAKRSLHYKGEIQE